MARQRPRCRRQALEAWEVVRPDRQVHRQARPPAVHRRLRGLRTDREAIRRVPAPVRLRDAHPRRPARPHHLRQVEHRQLAASRMVHVDRVRRHRPHRSVAVAVHRRLAMRLRPRRSPVRHRLGNRAPPLRHRLSRLLRDCFRLRGRPRLRHLRCRPPRWRQNMAAPPRVCAQRALARSVEGGFIRPRRGRRRKALCRRSRMRAMLQISA